MKDSKTDLLLFIIRVNFVNNEHDYKCFVHCYMRYRLLIFYYSKHKNNSAV